MGLSSIRVGADRAATTASNTDLMAFSQSDFRTMGEFLYPSSLVKLIKHFALKLLIGPALHGTADAPKNLVRCYLATNAVNLFSGSSALAGKHNHS